MDSQIPARRRFLIQAVVTTVALPLLGAAGAAQAQALKKLLPSHPQAAALGYVELAGANKAPTFKPGSNCANCQFFTAGTGACTLFPGYSVAAKGWCSAWAKKA